MQLLLLIKVDENGEEQWSKTYGEDGNDRGVDLVLTDDGHYMMLSNRSNRIHLAKLDESGNVIWDYLDLVTTGQGDAASLIKTDDGAYIPSPFALKLATSPVTDFDNTVYENPHTGNKKVLMVCTEERNMTMKNHHWVSIKDNIDRSTRR